MKKNTMIALTTALALGMASLSFAGYVKGYKVTGQHNGIVNIQSGALDYEDGELIGGNFVIDMASNTVSVVPSHRDGNTWIVVSDWMRGMSL